MKKLLILAYDFPPYVSVGGLRPYSWYKYLKKIDIYPIVVTRQWDNKYGNHLDYIAPSKSKKTIIEKTEYGIIIRTPYKPNLANRIMLKYGENRFRIFRKIISAFFEFAQWFFPVGTKVNLYKEAKKYLKNNNVDAIIATGEPFVLFRYAHLLNKRYKMPWIADYRDPWSLNSVRSNNFISKAFNKYLEKKYANNIEIFTTVSELFAHETLKVIHKKAYRIITNGYDDDILNTLEHIKQNTERFSIGYAGTIYNWHPIESFLSVCNEFVVKFPNVEINFYGVNISNKIKLLIKERFKNLANVVNIYSLKPNAELLQELEKQSILLLFNYYSYVGTKIYDYLALRRKILFCYTNDKDALTLKERYYNIEEDTAFNNHLQEDIIKETNSGVLVKDKEHLKQVLQDLYKEHQDRGFVECNSKGIEKYSRRLQVEKLAEIIKGIG